MLEKGAIPLNVDKFQEIAHIHDALILDTRHKNEWPSEHIPNSIFIGIDGTFAPWVGALIRDVDQPILLITHEGREKEVVKRLARVGYDNEASCHEHT